MMQTEEVKQIILEAGACAAGIAPCEPVSHEDAQLYDSWIENNHHGPLGYMTRYPDLRRNPALLLEGSCARSVIVAAFRYPSSTDLPYAPGGVRWARYAVGDDYHDVLRRRPTAATEKLASLSDKTPAFRITVDSAPMRERYWAWRAGVGIIGLNGQLIVPGIGSWVLLATIVTDLSIAPTSPLSLSPSPACLMCRRCVEACPGHALDGHGGVDAARCLSCLTIENRDPELTPEIAGYLRASGRLYGCDICQEVCPMGMTSPSANRADSTDDGSTGFIGVIPELRPRAGLLTLTPEDLRLMDQSTFSATFARSAIKRAKLAGLRRNAGSPLPPSPTSTSSTPTSDEHA